MCLIGQEASTRDNAAEPERKVRENLSGAALVAIAILFAINLSTSSNIPALVAIGLSVVFFLISLNNLALIAILK